MQDKIRIFAALLVGATLTACDMGGGEAINEDGAYEGSLTQMAPRMEDGSAYVIHSITLEAGQELDVRLMSDDFDAYLQIRDPNDEVLGEDDDSGGGTNAHLTMMAPMSGRYEILANSFSADEYGDYTMHIRREMLGEVVGVYRGELDLNDPKTFSEFIYPTERLEANAGEVYEIILMSPEFDTYLVVEDENGLAIAEDDDSAGSTNSKVTLPVAADGTYTIVVKSYDDFAGGAYTLTIMRSADTVAAGAMSVEQFTGALSDESPRLPEDGSPYYAHFIDLEAGDEIDVTMMAPDFDAYLQIWDADGNSLVQDDDSGGGYNARATMMVPTAGRYQIIANSFSEDAVGDYTLMVRTRSIAAEIEAGTVQLFTGALSADSETMADGSPYAAHEIQAESGERLDITLTSGDFDAYLMVFDENDEKIAEDDDSGGGLDAQLFVTIPADGTYRILANSYGESAEGEYLMTIRRQ